MSRTLPLLDRLTTPTAMAAVVILPLFAVGCGKTEPQSTTPSEALSPVEKKPKWDYSKERGPEQWGELTPDYVLAAIGRSQSPMKLLRPTSHIWSL